MLSDESVRVVVVEDSEAFLLRLRVALSELPVQVVGSAATTADAISVIDRTQPDLVLLDVFLQASSGVDVLRHLGNVGSKARTLVMTSEQAEELKSACLALGAYGFFDKPSLVLSLESQVSSLLTELGEMQNRRGRVVDQ
ncbi:MAG TPA: response regulator [Bryobacteraceae bacterium]|nr:response regulator [Bryobacteraceae bacterium]